MDSIDSSSFHMSDLEPPAPAIEHRRPSSGELEMDAHPIYPLPGPTPMTTEASPHTTSSSSANGAELPTAYPGLKARLALAPLNSLSIYCIVLALLVALFSAVLKSGLRTETSILTEQCFGRLALRHSSLSQAFSGLNATLWNMQATSMSGMRAAVSAYQGAANAICTASPADSSRHASCGLWNATNVSDAAYASASSQAHAILKTAQQSLDNLASEVYQDSSEHRCTARMLAVEKAEVAISRVATVWVTLIALATLLATLFAGFTEFKLWHFERLVRDEFFVKYVDYRASFHLMRHYSSSAIADMLSKFFVRDESSLKLAYSRWAWNCSLSTNMSKIIQLSIFLLIDGIANSTILNKVGGAAPLCTPTAHSASIEQQFNKDLAGLVSRAIQDFANSQAELESSLASAVKVDLRLPQPFIYGVGLEYVRLMPLDSGCWERGVGRLSGTSTTELLQNMNFAVLLCSGILLAIWASFSGFVYGVASCRYHSVHPRVTSEK